MTASIVAGVTAGLGAALLSEALLRCWAHKPQLSALKVSMLGVALRTGWVLAALILALVSGWWQPAPFTLALLTTYMAAQVLEAVRYRRFIDER